MHWVIRNPEMGMKTNLIQSSAMVLWGTILMMMSMAKTSHHRVAHHTAERPLSMVRQKTDDKKVSTKYVIPELTESKYNLRTIIVMEENIKL